MLLREKKIKAIPDWKQGAAAGVHAEGEILSMSPIGVAVVGCGWCGGIRAETLAGHPLVSSLHVAEVRPERLKEIAQKTRAKTATADYKELLSRNEIEAVYISATPESTHYPMARDFLAAGKHVFLEKPIALELSEADELIAIVRKTVKFSIGYSQRFNPKYAYVQQVASATARIGRPVSALVSRHITRGLGKKISGRIKLSPAAMESTHDLDFVLWCLEPAKPVRVYSQVNYGAMREASGAARARHAVDHGHHGQRPVVRRRRRLEPAAGLSELLHHLDRDGRHRGRVAGRRHATATWCSTR